jgi:hypothetical protein
MILITFRPTVIPYGTTTNLFGFLQDQYESVQELVAHVRSNLPGFISVERTTDSQVIVWRESPGYRHMHNSGIHWKIV